MLTSYGSTIPFLTSCFCNATYKPALFLIFLLLAGSSQRAAAQGLSASAPTKEFLYLGGRLVAIEERGSGTQANAVGVTHHPASAASTVPSGPANSAPPPTLPTPGVMPTNTSGTPASLPVTTPASTHTTAAAAAPH